MLGLRHSHFLELITFPSFALSATFCACFRSNRDLQIQRQIPSFQGTSLSTKQEHMVDTANTVLHTSAVHPQSLGFGSNIFCGYDGIQGFIPTKLFLILLALRLNIITVSSGKILCTSHEDLLEAQPIVVGIRLYCKSWYAANRVISCGMTCSGLK